MNERDTAAWFYRWQARWNSSMLTCLAFYGKEEKK